MRNVCDTCGYQKNRKPGSWFCTKYGIPMHIERIYCVSKGAKDREQVQEQKDGG